LAEGSCTAKSAWGWAGMDAPRADKGHRLSQR
jgi:hypothetical protein